MTAAAVALVVGGGAAVTYGLTNQHPDPVAPPVAEAGRPIPTATPTAPPPPSPEPTRAPEPVESTEPRVPPVSVHIPALDVRSELTAVGLNPDGTLEVPQPGPDYDKAAWYDGSPAPGQTGPAVVLGHVDGPNGPSVFYELGSLQPGDLVEVVRVDGSTVTFVVDVVESYPKANFPTKRVYGNTDRPELRLITCSGEFDRAARSHLDNTVVYAHQV